ncbi:multicomponent Na+:H+ antiporter subunit E [Alkalispirochaeta americana]|uniref:Multicomponent Na+:H+ antiporter subunit E n=1 Tax=Alkalispirochaeta americana TaxID=159291 RepID=A0A1N6TFU3_9SPIO|nr:Na+/H+ antiporter subunit E [Alkalispirochaeta americana]SIQ52259.1 multicomponent Na+:H+ antiporter subunit E [Alkalispirochaeta americana]
MVSILAAVSLFLLWFLFVGAVTVADGIAGGVIVLTSLFLFRRSRSALWFPDSRQGPDRGPSSGSPRGAGALLKGLLAGALFLPVFAGKIFLSGLQITFMALQPSITFWPGIVRVRTGLSGMTGVTALANTITLTPGTLSLDYVADGDALFIHWIDVSEYDAATLDQQVTGGLRPWVKRILE